LVGIALALPDEPENQTLRANSDRPLMQSMMFDGERMYRRKAAQRAKYRRHKLKKHSVIDLMAWCD